MIFDSKKLLLIAGPCSLENERICRTVAEKLVEIGRAQPELRLVFKGSFDKANRTSLAGERGTGLDAGLKLLALVKRDYGLPVLTDVHETQQVPAIAAVCDVVQIPAFLCRQTDLLLAAAASGRVVNVKKGQFLSPQEMTFVTGKLREGGAREIWQTERGTTFGYQNLVVDMRSFALMKQNGFPTVFDATHSVQLPGAAAKAAASASSSRRSPVPRSRPAPMDFSSKPTRSPKRPSATVPAKFLSAKCLRSLQAAWRFGKRCALLRSMTKSSGGQVGRAHPGWLN